MQGSTLLRQTVLFQLIHPPMRHIGQRVLALSLIALIPACSGPTATAQSVAKGLAGRGAANGAGKGVGDGTQGSLRAASGFNVAAQTSCETEMLEELGAHEVFSGEAYDVLSGIVPAYGRPTPHVYVYPGGWNMFYIASSAAVDGRGKIMVGEQAAGLFDPLALRGFLGHEMAHLVSDNGALGCNDFIVRNTRIEADADALAARVLGKQPVRAFLERVLVLTQGQNPDARGRLDLLR